MSDDSLRRELAIAVLRVGLIAAASYLTVKWMINAIDPTRKQKSKAKEKAEKTLQRIGISAYKNVLSEYELTIASQLVNPEELEISWKDIAGLDDIIDELQTTVILPLKVPNLTVYSKLHEPPKGVLLYGPPGVGKTMVAKATAKEAGARFINLDISALTDKWYGESQKLAAAVFTLAIKIQPCIIFIDEIDSFLRKRETHDHEATSMMKAQFMILWDGLISNNNCSVIVMGATNRPNDVDNAIRRRMPATFHISLPNNEQRQKILQLILSKESLDHDVDLVSLAKQCETFSGSDLKELCRLSAMIRIKELSHSYSNQIDHTNIDQLMLNLRPIQMKDFLMALDKMKRTKNNVLVNGSEFFDKLAYD
ncbi:outer mitochondrial transmembrane helix translocase [Dermatophagoides farinae]|uniref:outer mitochondrial transmembrane helix translocase n=1 Tax=Dermatophagoides farinae TaxID=6954 RepID=UPI003F5F0AFA